MRNYLLGGIVLLAAVFSAAGCSKKHDAEIAKTAAVTVVKGVTLETVKAVAVPDLLDVIGSVRARTSAVVSTRIPGSISVLRVREGDRVKKGQLLLQLDAQENQATAAVATAAIDEAHRGLDEALSRKKLADSTYDRYSNLLKEQAISRQEFDVRQAEKIWQPRVPHVQNHGSSRLRKGRKPPQRSLTIRASSLHCRGLLPANRRISGQRFFRANR